MSTYARTIRVNWGISGLAGSLAARVVDVDDSILVARATSGVTEWPAGSGIYRKKIAAWDDSWTGMILWDDGAETPTHAVHEDFLATAASGGGGNDEVFEVFEENLVISP